jgi:hypothetical protein
VVETMHRRFLNSAMYRLEARRWSPKAILKVRLESRSTWGPAPNPGSGEQLKLALLPPLKR